MYVLHAVWGSSVSVLVRYKYLGVFEFKHIEFLSWDFTIYLCRIKKQLVEHSMSSRLNKFIFLVYYRIESILQFQRIYRGEGPDREQLWSATGPDQSQVQDRVQRGRDSSVAMAEHADRSDPSKSQYHHCERLQQDLHNRGCPEGHSRHERGRVRMQTEQRTISNGRQVPRRTIQDSTWVKILLPIPTIKESTVGLGVQGWVMGLYRLVFEQGRDSPIFARFQSRGSFWILENSPFWDKLFYRNILWFKRAVALPQRNW